MKENRLNFQSENLTVDWIGFNIQGSVDPKPIAFGLTKYFTPQVLIDDIPSLGFHGLKKKHKVSVRQYTGSKGYWVGTQIIFSGKDAAYFYKLIKTEKFDWGILKFDRQNLSLGRIDICFSRPNDFNHASKSFDAFLIDSRSQIQNHTTTRHIRLQDFPDGKILKVNRRNNSVHYRVYQKNERVRFKLELKHRKTKLVQDYLFQNKLDVFEDLLVMEYFKYSEKVLCIDYQYTDWILDFQRRSRVRQLVNSTSRSLTTSYLESQIIEQQEEEEKFFHLLEFLSFVKSLRLNPLKDFLVSRSKLTNFFFLRFIKPIASCSFSQPF